jgi:putative alpha-1,2-mannosidase
VVTLADGKQVVINAKDNSEANRYVGKLTVNGKVYDRNYLDISQLKQGAKLNFTMTDTPNTSRGTSSAAAPYSFSE